MCRWIGTIAISLCVLSTAAQGQKLGTFTVHNQGPGYKLSGAGPDMEGTVDPDVLNITLGADKRFVASMLTSHGEFAWRYEPTKRIFIAFNKANQYKALEVHMNKKDEVETIIFNRNIDLRWKTLDDENFVNMIGNMYAVESFEVGRVQVLKPVSEEIRRTEGRKDAVAHSINFVGYQPHAQISVYKYVGSNHRKLDEAASRFCWSGDTMCVFIRPNTKWN